MRQLGARCCWGGSRMEAHASATASTTTRATGRRLGLWAALLVLLAGNRLLVATANTGPVDPTEAPLRRFSSCAEPGSLPVCCPDASAPQAGRRMVAAPMSAHPPLTKGTTMSAAHSTVVGRLQRSLPPDAWSRQPQWRSRPTAGRAARTRRPPTCTSGRRRTRRPGRASAGCGSTPSRGTCPTRTRRPTCTSLRRRGCPAPWTLLAPTQTIAHPAIPPADDGASPWAVIGLTLACAALLCGAALALAHRRRARRSVA